MNIQPRIASPAPEGFKDRFIQDGWRGIERYYGARTDVMLRWIAECGGLVYLQALRKDYRMEQMERFRA